MNRHLLRNIIFLGAFLMLALSVSQILWLCQAYELEKQKFEEKVTLLLNDVAKTIVKTSEDKSIQTTPVQKVSNNAYIVRINEPLHPIYLENILKQEFQKKGVCNNYELSIYDCFTDSVVFRKVIKASRIIENPESPLNWKEDGHYFGVQFLNLNLEFLYQVRYLVIISLLAFALMGIFIYGTTYVLKQKKLTEIKNDFINNMTHELKTPISTIALSCEVLTSDDILDDKERLRNYAQIIKKENLQLQNLVESVLAASVYDKKTILLQKREVDVHKVLQTLADRFEVKLKNKNGKIIYVLNAEKHIIYGDEMHITNIFMNIVDNALKYTIENPLITISTSNKNSHIIVSVKDNGIGMDKKYLNLIYDKFYRITSGNIHNTKGFGLGLSYVKRFVNLHHGSIYAKSELNKGSEFIVEFPILKH